MPPVSPPAPERARKIVRLVLQRLQEPGSGVAMAVAMGCSESTISRIKSDHLETFALLLAHAGLKVVPVEFKCVDASAYSFLTKTHEKIMRAQPDLIWDADE